MPHKTDQEKQGQLGQVDDEVANLEICMKLSKVCRTKTFDLLSGPFVRIADPGTRRNGLHTRSSVGMSTHAG